ncbi:MAG: cell division protein ZipA [Proteobacteria bacterium]|nr:cell division protein ZipA [Pseudomonadota bacterium]
MDLESLEFAELPGGAARIVDRGLDQQATDLSAVAAANLKAEALDLGAPSQEGASIPVLMDAVALANPGLDAAGGQLEFEDEFAEAAADFVDDEARSGADVFLAEDSLSAEGSLLAEGSLSVDGAVSAEGFESPGAEEDPDAVLLDYEQSQPDADDLDAEDEDEDDRVRANYDALAAVKPDYPEPEEDLDIDAESAIEAAVGAEDELGSFSMTAGERIGFSATPEPVALPDEPDDEIPTEETRSWRQTVFAIFGAKKKQKKTQLDEPVMPVMGATGAGLEAASTDPEPETETPADDVPPATSAVATEPSEVIVINVMAREGDVFGGDELLEVLLGVGLSFGEMNIFHQHLGAEVKAPVLFSVANILNPGSFDLNNMDAFSTTGVSLFLALPAAVNNLEAFEQMLAVAQQIQAALDGELKDDHRNVMTAQTMEHYRQRIHDFELRRLKAVGGRG